MAAELVFTDPTAHDIAELTRCMRPLDRGEVLAARGPDLLGAVASSVAISANSIAVRAPAGLLAIFGCAPVSLLGNTAAPWMLGTDLLAHHPRTLSRVARRYIHAMREHYPVLVNHVDARNAPAIRLLRWLGFSILPAAPYGVAGLPFHRFELRSA